MKIQVTFDLFRSRTYGLVSVAENVRWVHSMLRHALRNLPAIVELYTGLDEGGTFDSGAVIKRLGVPQTADGWAQLVSHPGLVSAPELAELYSADLVVGFGLTPALINGLAKAGVQVIDLEMAPLRLGRRQYLRVRTTSPSIAAVLHGYEASDDDITYSVQAIAGRHARYWPQGAGNRSRGVILGQTYLDLSIVENGRLASLEDEPIFDRLRELAGSVDEVYVLPHPACPDRLNNIHRILFEIPNNILDSESSYAFLSDPGTKWVAALSSGALDEAACFGIPTHRLIHPDRDNPALLPPTMTSWMIIHDTFFSPQFWRKVVERKKPRRFWPLILGRERSSSPPLPQPGLLAETVGRIVGANIDLPPHIPLRVLAVGARYATGLGNLGDQLFRFGWHGPEEWGRWSGKRYASLAFRVEEEEKVIVELRMEIYAPHPTVTPEIHIRKPGDTELTPVELRHDSEGSYLELEFNPLETDGLFSILFRVNVPISPQSVGQSGDQRPLGIALRQIVLRPADGGPMLDLIQSRQTIANDRYYSFLHATHEGFQQNNWLAPFARTLGRLKAKRVVECGTGNGAFASAIADYCSDVIGLDWAPSPHFPRYRAGISFQLWDALKDLVPPSDLVCSADFLEHMPPIIVTDVLRNMLSAAPAQFHVMACYDDGHSHLTIESAEAWLSRFNDIAADIPNPNAGPFRICGIPSSAPDRPRIVITNVSSLVLDF
jgi:hypothetical protein